MVLGGSITLESLIAGRNVSAGQQSIQLVDEAFYENDP